MICHGPALLNAAAYSSGLVGVILLIWSLLTQRLSLLGLALLIAGSLFFVVLAVIATEAPASSSPLPDNQTGQAEWVTQLRMAAALND